MNAIRVLFVPDSSLTPYVRTRGEEIARQVARKHHVYFLNWGRKDTGTPLAKLYFRVRHKFASKSEYEYKSLRVITMPHSDFDVLKVSIFSNFISERDCRFNKKLLEELAQEKKIDVIISQSRRMWDVTDLGMPFLYDVSDIPYDGKFKGLMKEQMVHANRVICISHFIQKAIQKQLNLDAIVVPNGVNLDEFRRTESQNSKNSSAKTIGLIGNHGWWSGLDFLLDVFKKIQNKFQLWIIGGGSELPRAIKKAKKEKIENVKFFGPLPKDQVIRYFKAVDLGVVPFEKTVFTEAALPIKVLEHTAARKFVLAVDLTELKCLKLSNLVLRPRDEKSWIDTVYELMERKWDSNWDEEINEYDWKVLAEKIFVLLENI